jgi:stress response protein SCP2
VITTSTLIKRMLRIPLKPFEADLGELEEASERGDGTSMAYRLDAALLSVGFKLSAEALRYLARNNPGFVRMTAVRVLSAVRELVGDHVQHNAYFINFPVGVPDTMEFWISMLRRALVPASGRVVDDSSIDAELREVLASGAVNLLDLPGYGTYPHSFEELVNAHESFIPAMKDRVTILHLGESMFSELLRLFEVIAGSSTPPSPADRGLLIDLVRQLGGNLHANLNFEMPGRETKAVVNAAILADCGEIAGSVRPLVQIDTITDVLRAVDMLSGGDGTLERAPASPVVRTMDDLLARTKGDITPVTARKGSGRTRLVSLRRPQRRAVMRALQDVLSRDRSSDKLADVYRHREAWKRLAEGVHPHEWSEYPLAQRVFAVARGEIDAPATPYARFEKSMAQGDPVLAAHSLVDRAPGEFARHLDRLLRHPHSNIATMLDLFSLAAGKVSGRVLLSLLEHFRNRTDGTLPRTFVNRSGRLYVTPETRAPLSMGVFAGVRSIVEFELTARLDEVLSGGPAMVVDGDGNLVRRPIVIDPAIDSVALPLSNKSTAAGLNVLPRGSRVRLDQEVLRFFTYWRQRRECTDFDLSAVLLDEDFQSAGHISWTSYHDADGAATYSGDITNAPDGATEFIDISLGEISPRVRYLVPQVHVYSGEDFGVTGEESNAVAESIFGFMTMDRSQRGMPFEARAVRTKADMRGRGRVAMPLVFERRHSGWWAKWVHLYLRGQITGGRADVEAPLSAMLAEAVIRRRYLTVGHLTSLVADLYEATSFEGTDLTELELDGPVTYIGLQAPEGLPEGSRVITAANLTEILPA